MTKFFRWGLMGPGKIAHRFASSFGGFSHAKIAAVASRDKERGQSFAAQYNIPTCYNGYESLARDPEIDAIYISTPHAFHRELTLLCLEHKKPVLCEKPLTLNHKYASEMVAAARKNNTFLMEAMWTCFFPSIRKMMELVRSGAIGEVKFLRGDFGFNAPFDPQSRLYNLALGGGAMLDVGVYPLFLALHVLGRPDEIKAFAHLAPTGADKITNALLYYKNGAIASLLSSIVNDTPKTAEIMGTKGRITLHAPWYKATALTLETEGGSPQTFSMPYDGPGFAFQVQEVMQCVEKGLKESPLMPLDFSLLMAEVSDEVRRQCHIRYENE